MVAKTRKASADDTAAKAEERKARRAALEAVSETFELDESDSGMMRAFRALSEHYSENNSLLILAQAEELGLEVRGPDDVAAFRTWLTRERKVRKGEHQSIFIWQPCGISTSEKVEEAPTEENGKNTVTRRYFRITGLFHKSQTEPLKVKERPRG